MDCSPRWVDTAIHQLPYSRRIRDEGKLIRKALFRVLKYALPHSICVLYRLKLTVPQMAPHSTLEI